MELKSKTRESMFVSRLEVSSLKVRRFFCVCPPEGGACSSWIKHGFSHSLRQRLRGVTGKWFGRVG